MRLFRRDFGRVVATLVGVFRDLDLAEGAVQDAFVARQRTWPEPDPGGWITTTA